MFGRVNDAAMRIVVNAQNRALASNRQVTVADLAVEALLTREVQETLAQFVSCPLEEMISMLDASVHPTPLLNQSGSPEFTTAAKEVITRHAIAWAESLGNVPDPVVPLPTVNPSHILMGCLVADDSIRSLLADCGLVTDALQKTLQARRDA